MQLLYKFILNWKTAIRSIFPSPLPLLLLQHLERAASAAATKGSFAMELQKMSPLSTDRANHSSPISRRTANYMPSIWEDTYIQSLPEDSLDATQFDSWEKLKEEVRQMILDIENDTIKLLELIDVLRQFGVSYHFENEIKNTLSYIGSTFKNLNNNLEKNLHGFALLFRLLREYGIKEPNLSANFFLNGFKNKSGSFSSGIINDVIGMLSLFEASYLAIEGEDELDEAREFTVKHLTNYLKESCVLNPQLVEQIEHAMELPIHWGMPRQHTRWFIDFYEKQDNINPKLFEFAKLDFNMVQSLYKKELKEVSRWWSSLGLTGEEFSFTRDRLAENYFWGIGCSFEPEFWRCRKVFTKLGVIITTIDDIYDVYGFLEELKLFTKAVEDWKIPDQQLPNPMKKTLKALFDTANDFAREISLEKELDVLPHLKRVWRDQCNAYLVEATWYHTGYIPTLNEYIENAWVSISVHVFLIHAYCASENLTKEALDKIDFNPDVAHYSAVISRLYNDMGTSHHELQRGDVSSAIHCHMNEANVSESVARDHIRYLIKKHWKLLNGEDIPNSNFEESYKRYLLNTARATQEFYLYGDEYGRPQHKIKDKIISLIIDPIPL